MLIEKYERYIEMIKKHHAELQNELFELGVKDLTNDEREYQNDLMGYIQHANLTISVAGHNLRKLKRNTDA